MGRVISNKILISARRVLCIALCLAAVLCAFPFSAFADSSGGLGYQWTRMKSADDMRKFSAKGKTDRDPDRHLVSGNYVSGSMSSMTGDSNADHWFKVLIVFNDKYFISGSDTCNDGEGLSATRILPSYHMDTTKDTFETTSGYFAPYIRYAGTDKDNSQNGQACDKYVFRVANSEDNIGSKVIAFCANWYGIQYAAAVYGQFWHADATKLDTIEYKMSCSATLHPDATFSWKDGKVNMFYNIKGAVDRDWTDSDGDNKITVTKYPSDSQKYFKIFIGVPKPVSQIKEDTSIAAATTTTLRDTIITEGKEITVPKNATLIFEGSNQNNGRITVDGGTLIINGNLECDIGQNSKGSLTETKHGSIYVKNGGLLYIQNEGILIQTSYGSVLDLSSGSTCVIDGSCVIGRKVSIDRSSLSVRAGASLIVGVAPKAMADKSCFGRTYIKDNKDKVYLSDLVDSKVQYSPTQIVPEFVIGTNGSFDCDGMFFFPSIVSANSTYYADYMQSTNINATIGSMVRKW